MTTSLKEQFDTKILPALLEGDKFNNRWAVPRIEKIVVNVGSGQMSTEKKLQEVIKDTLRRITGQEPSLRRARLSIASFKLREGAPIGMQVTLRGKRMYDFLDKLINVTMPRVRDFRGISPNSFDGKGNLTIGFKEHMAFPEIRADEVEHMHGLQVVIVTTADNNEDGYALLDAIGVPFQKGEQLAAAEEEKRVREIEKRRAKEQEKEARKMAEAKAEATAAEAAAAEAEAE
ncbi:50S ribosomal protein L5 [Patescibacteria group bacterium]